MSLIQYHLAGKHKPLLHFEEKKLKRAKVKKEGWGGVGRVGRGRI